MNELAPADLFDLEQWANNMLGLCIVASLLCVSIVLVAWSLRTYFRSLRIDGRQIFPMDHPKATKNNYNETFDVIVNTETSLSTR